MRVVFSLPIRLVILKKHYYIQTTLEQPVPTEWSLKWAFLCYDIWSCVLDFARYGGGGVGGVCRCRCRDHSVSVGSIGVEHATRFRVKRQFITKPI